MEQAGIIKNGSLISLAQWQQTVDALRIPETACSEEEAAESVLKALTSEVRRRIPTVPFGVMLSGGLDSTLLALLYKQAGAHPPCLVVGTENSPDVLFARRAAAFLGLPLVERIISQEDVAHALDEVGVLLPGMDSRVQRDIAAAEILVFSLAKAQGLRFLVSGLGAEETFAGYQRHRLAQDVNGECWRGLREDLYVKDFSRGVPIAAHFGIGVLAPFLGASAVQAAMEISGELKIAQGTNKYALRLAARRAGLPDEFAMRKKLAMQYGSRTQQEARKIASGKGLRS